MADAVCLLYYTINGFGEKNQIPLNVSNPYRLLVVYRLFCASAFLIANNAILLAPPPLLAQTEYK